MGNKFTCMRIGLHTLYVCMHIKMNISILLKMNISVLPRKQTRKRETGSQPRLPFVANSIVLLSGNVCDNHLHYRQCKCRKV